MLDNKLSSSLEDYLEAILALTKDRPFAHANQIAEYLRVAKSSVSWALGQLAKKGLVNYKPYEAITLTEKGRKRAKQVAHRHEDIKRFLMEVLAVDEVTAQENACRLEHVIDHEVLLRMKQFLQTGKPSPVL